MRTVPTPLRSRCGGVTAAFAAHNAAHDAVTAPGPPYLVHILRVGTCNVLRCPVLRRDVLPDEDQDLSGRDAETEPRIQQIRQIQQRKLRQQRQQRQQRQKAQEIERKKECMSKSANRGTLEIHDYNGSSTTKLF